MTSNSTVKVKLIDSHEISDLMYNHIYTLTYPKSIDCVVKKINKKSK
jgi:hypothetical protein